MQPQNTNFNKSWQVVSLLHLKLNEIQDISN